MTAEIWKSEATQHKLPEGFSSVSLFSKFGVSLADCVTEDHHIPAAVCHLIVRRIREKLNNLDVQGGSAGEYVFHIKTLEELTMTPIQITTMRQDVIDFLGFLDCVRCCALVPWRTRDSA